MKTKGYRKIIREYRHKTGLNHDLPEPDENDDEPEEYGTAAPVDEDGNMNALRDEIAAACLLASRL